MVVLFTRIGDSCLSAREVLEVNEHTLMVIEKPQKIDFTIDQDRFNLDIVLPIPVGQEAKKQE